MEDKYMMAESKDNSFDTKEWSLENGKLAKKAYEKWKADNSSAAQKEQNPKDASNKPADKP